MNINKSLLGVMASLSLAAFGTTVMAAPVPTPIALTGGASSDNTQFTTSSSGDSLVISYNDGTFIGKVGNGTFSPVAVSLTALGGTTKAGSTSSSFEEDFTSGKFSVFNGATDLISGTFASGILTNASSDNGAFGVTGVVYDAASTALPSTFALTGGTVSPEFLSITPPYSVVSGQLQDFTATDGITYSALKAAPVPEAAGMVPFALGGLSLLGLIVRGRKTRQASEMAS